MVASGLLGLFIYLFIFISSGTTIDILVSDGIHTALSNPIGCSIQRSAGEWKGEEKKKSSFIQKKKKKEKSNNVNVKARAHQRPEGTDALLKVIAEKM